MVKGKPLYLKKQQSHSITKEKPEYPQKQNTFIIKDKRLYLQKRNEAMQEPGRQCVINGKVITAVKTEIECVHKGGDWMIFESANTPTLSPDESKGTLPDNSPEINRTIPPNNFGNDTMYR